jgi:hypothetical protein
LRFHQNDPFLARGTDGSNPSPSSGESVSRSTQIISRTPEWIAARLWEMTLAQEVTPDSALRRWVDLWGLLQHPSLVPGAVWSTPDAKALREAARRAIATEPGLGGWIETRDLYVQQAALAHNVTVAVTDSRFPRPPDTLAQPIEASAYDSLDICADLFGLVRLLLADADAEDHSPAPHAAAAQIVDLAIDRTELLSTPSCSDPFGGRVFSPRQEACTHQEFVDGAGALPAFADCPNDERLAPPHVAGGEEVGDRGVVVDRIGTDVPAGIEIDTGLLDHAGPARTEKAHRQQDEIRLQSKRGARDLLHHKAVIRVLAPFHPHAFEGHHSTVFASGVLGQHRPIPFAAFLLR